VNFISEEFKYSRAGIGKEADLINAKTRGYLTYPSSNLYVIVKRLEE